MGIFDWKHWIVILVVVVLVFGTKKLKNLGTDVGESIKGFRKAMNDDEKTGRSDRHACAAGSTGSAASHRSGQPAAHHRRAGAESRRADPQRRVSTD